jgi:hypothetical protein
MKQALRSAVIVLAAALVVMQGFVPFFESMAAEQNCLSTQAHHAQWAHDQAASHEPRAPHAPPSHRICCHQKPYVSAISLPETPAQRVTLISYYEYPEAAASIRDLSLPVEVSPD